MPKIEYLSALGPKGPKHQLDSQLEVDYARGLDEQKARGEILGWRSQVSFQLWGSIPTLDGVLRPIVYTADFVVKAPGRYQIVECKGYWRPDGRLRWRIMEHLFAREGPRIMERAGGYTVGGLDSVELVLHQRPVKRKERAPRPPAEVQPIGQQERMSAAEYRRRFKEGEL